MTINPTNGVLSWQSGITNASTTNTVTVRVSDNGFPPLSDTETLSIIVTSTNVVPAPTDLESLATGGFRISWSAEPGLTYRLERAESLMSPNCRLRRITAGQERTKVSFLRSRGD